MKRRSKARSLRRKDRLAVPKGSEVVVHCVFASGRVIGHIALHNLAILEVPVPQ